MIITDALRITKFLTLFLTLNVNYVTLELIKVHELDYFTKGKQFVLPFLKKSFEIEDVV